MGREPPAPGGSRNSLVLFRLWTQLPTHSCASQLVSFRPGTQRVCTSPKLGLFKCKPFYANTLRVARTLFSFRKVAHPSVLPSSSALRTNPGCYSPPTPPAPPSWWSPGASAHKLLSVSSTTGLGLGGPGRFTASSAARTFCIRGSVCRHSLVTTWGRGTLTTWWVGAREGAQRPPMCQTAPQ